MLKIDDNLLQQIGLGSLPTEDKRGLLAHIYETLEMRVGMRLADQMTNEQLDEFEMYFEAKDDAGAFKWLESNFPNYKDIVNEEFEKLKNEVAQAAPQIIAAAQANPAPAAPQQPISQGNDYQQPQPQPAYQQPLPQQPYQPLAQPQTPGYQPQDAPAPAQPYAAPPAPVDQSFQSPMPQQPQQAPQSQPWPQQQPPAGPAQPSEQPWNPPQPPPTQPTQPDSPAAPWQPSQDQNS